MKDAVGAVVLIVVFAVVGWSSRREFADALQNEQDAQDAQDEYVRSVLGLKKVDSS